MISYVRSQPRYRHLSAQIVNSITDHKRDAVFQDSPYFMHSTKSHRHVHNRATSSLYLILNPNISNRKLYHSTASFYILYISMQSLKVAHQGQNMQKVKVKLKQSHYRPGGFQEAETPRLEDNRHMKAVRLSALGIGRLYLQDIFLVLISVRG